MSPPQVSLAVKETPPTPTVSDEDLQDKCDDLEKFGSLELPAVIPVEPADRPANPRYVRNQQKQRARRIMCCVALIIIMTVAALGTMALVHRLRRHHRKEWQCRFGAKRLPEHVKVDHTNNLIRVQHDHDRDTNTPAMEILHEYNRGLVVYKDVDRKICYIDRLDETFVNGYERWQSYEKTDRTKTHFLRVISKPIEVEVMEHVMDVHITAHCRDSHRFWVMEIEEIKVTKEMRVIKV